MWIRVTDISNSLCQWFSNLQLSQSPSFLVPCCYSTAILDFARSNENHRRSHAFQDGGTGRAGKIPLCPCECHSSFRCHSSPFGNHWSMPMAFELPVRLAIIRNHFPQLFGCWGSHVYCKEFWIVGKAHFPFLWSDFYTIVNWEFTRMVSNPLPWVHFRRRSVEQSFHILFTNSG